MREINRRGVALARDVRESSGRDVFVLGSIGPLGKYLAPLGTVTSDEARAAFREQAEALLEGGDGALRVGIEMAQDLVQAVRSRYGGAYLMPSFGRFEVVAEVLDAIR